MKLHENTELFRDAVTATSQIKNIPEIYVEKDYWVTLALFLIFKSEIGKESIFKGGTALSKCNKLIDRFSEDIDIVILRKKSESSNQLKTKLKKITNAIENAIPEITIDGITNKKGMIRKTAHSYEKVFWGNFGQIKDNIIVEATWLGNYEPFDKGLVSSLIYEMMIEKEQFETIETYNIKPFEVLILSPKRTLCEKIMSLVRFSFSENPMNDLSNKIRHIYDIYMILKNKELNSFFKSNDFDKMLLRVANDDMLSFKNNNDWLSNHPKTAIIFSDTTNVWNIIRTTYQTSFKELVFGEFPSETEMLNTLKILSERIETIEWKIKE
jgi:hypothetical protein